jgi:hypothetical protein
MIRYLAALWLAILSTGALAQSVTVPNTFAAGQPAKAADVNANFQALVTAINALETRVSKLEGQFTSTDLQGAIYAIQWIQVGFGPYPSTWQDGYTGTVTLNADGSASLTDTDTDYSDVGGTQAKNVTTGSLSGTWTLSGQTLTFTGSNGGTITSTCISGGRLCIATLLGDKSGAVSLLALLRTN